MNEYRICSLSEVGTIVSGATPRTAEEDNFGGNIPWITPADLSGYSAKYISHGARSLTEKGYNSCATQLMPEGTVLFSSRAPIGYVAIASNPICTNQGFKSIIPNKSVLSEYLYYQLKYLKKHIQDLGSGTTFKEISAKKLSTVQVVVPSISKQRRIVAQIEELFSELDAGVETLQKLKQQLAVYRQAFLKTVFDRYQEYVPLGSISNSRLGKMLDKEKNIGTPRSYLRNVNVRWFAFDLSDMLEMRITDEEVDKYSIQKDDLVICEGGEPGRCAVWQEEESVFYQKALHRVRFTNGSNPRFYMYYLWFAAQTGRLTPYYTGMGIKHLTGESLVKVLVPSIDRTAQNSAVAEIEARLSMCEDIDRTIDKGVQQSAAMRQSILKQAFEGGL